MSEGGESVPVDEVPSERECYANAARLLRNAEMETDRQMMDNYDSLARTWMALGSCVAVDPEDAYT